jgi:hypothetical protein
VIVAAPILLSLTLSRPSALELPDQRGKGKPRPLMVGPICSNWTSLWLGEYDSARWMT